MTLVIVAAALLVGVAVGLLIARARERSFQRDVRIMRSEY